MVTLLHERQIPIAAQILRDGGTVAFRTETVYGLGATVENAEKIFAAKHRPADKSLVWQFPTVRACAEYFGDKILAPEIALLRHHRVGFTLVLGCGVAVRIPHDRVAKRLLRAVGVPLCVTSANLSGEPPATTWNEIEATLGEHIDAIVMSAPSKYGVPSTVAKINGKNVEILRQGFAKVRKM